MINPVRGMKDFYGDSLEQYNYVVQNALSVGEKHGYSIIKTPILEQSCVFQRAIGDETDVVAKEMYSFIDKGGDLLTLRPEGTAGVIRAVVSEGLTQNMPLKLMYYGEMFRYDRPQKGRFRQFHQIGFEHIGCKTPYADALIVVLACDILQKCEIADYQVFINTLGDDETRQNYDTAIIKFLTNYESQLSADSQRRLAKNPLRVLDSKDPTDQEICAAAPVISDYLSKEAYDYFSKVCSLLKNYGITFEIDNFLVRGLDYYSHTAFEIKTKAEKNALCGGGRYDKLLNMFGGPDVSGIGFAFGVERLMSLISVEKKKISKIAVVPFSENENDVAFNIIKMLYQNDIAAEFISTGNISKKMKIANRLSCNIAIIIGEEEVQTKTVMLKFMDKKDDAQKTVKLDELLAVLKNSLN